MEQEKIKQGDLVTWIADNSKEPLIWEVSGIGTGNMQDWAYLNCYDRDGNFFAKYRPISSLKIYKPQTKS